ncbi:Uncharacterised protein [Ectopseudomonas mendocina]|uniref:Uncharacterized protein n=1 Tax=Ectopseudomonas mendocina TaxID=300 RepID=A0A379PND5_ECTME|nr:hypothetical protein [Pseudomonas mendocina]SUE95876.1 Uncharacterised protein [Pseudomonas mendocina]
MSQTYTQEQIREMAKNSVRWKYYAARVAQLVGVSLEEMEREIDQAMERKNAQQA